MAWPYEYNLHVWLFLASAPFFAVLGVYAFRRRAVPGAVPFIVLVAGIIIWASAHTLGKAATFDSTRIFWFKFNAASLLPLVIAELCFVIEYAGLGKWLTRRTLVLLAAVPIIFLLLILTNDIHHLVWTKIWTDGDVHINRGPVNWGVVYYAYLLSALHVAVLARLFARSPRHRWIAAGLILTALIVRGAFICDVVEWNPVAPLDPMLVSVYFALVPYSLAFFRFHMFNVVPIGRDTVIERMPDGMMVLDAENRIADLNTKAKTLLGKLGPKPIGRPVEDALHAYPELLGLLRNSGETQCEVSLGDTGPHRYLVQISPIIDRRGFELGRLASLIDVTELKLAQTQVLHQQRALAVLEERELMARDIHDNLAQTLASAHLQVQTACELLARGDTKPVEACLQGLAEAVQESKESVRDFLAGVRSRLSSEHSLMPALRRYFDNYSRRYGIRIESIIPPELEEKRIDLAVEAQLQPIIQEALTNVRKHSGASSARVVFGLSDHRLRVTVEDPGRGFDPEDMSKSEGFGLRAMRGRANMVGASLEVNSAPGKGTQVIFQVPWPREGA